MKSFILACAILALASADWTPKIPEEINKLREMCYVETSLSEEGIELIKKGRYPHESSCYFRCMGLKLGIWDDTNGFNNDGISHMMNAAEYDFSKEQLSKCNTVTEKNDDPCIWATNVSKCLVDNKYVTKRI